MSAWQRIETGPKDGTQVLLFCPDEYPSIVVGSWNWLDLPKDHPDYWEGWNYADEVLCCHADLLPQPTHWQPLPEPPEAAP